MGDVIQFRTLARGWIPSIETVFDENRKRHCMQIVDWTGGSGVKPPVGKYVGAAGYVDDIGDAVSF